MRRVLIAIALLAGTSLASPFPLSPRFMYVVGCAATIDKVDLRTGLTVASYDLAKRTGGRPLVPVVEGTFDACLSNDLVFDARSSIFYTVVPTTDVPGPDGKKDYRVLGFSVPAVRVARVIAAGRSQLSPPGIRLDPRGAIRVLPAPEPDIALDVDLTGFTPERKPLVNQVLEQSGGRALLRLYVGKPQELVLAVADLGRGTLVRLEGLPRTTAPGVHLAPGGTHVLVEAMAGDSTSPERSGSLALYDAATGRVVKSVTDSRTKSLSFLALSPDGRVIYHANDRYVLVDLGVRFGTGAVLRPVPAGRPGVFFAVR